MIPSSLTFIGGAHIDRRGRITGSTAPGASNPGSWIEEPGGGAFNAARNLARLGHDVTMISMRGGDPAGDAVDTAAEEAGVSYQPFTFLDRATPSYTAILEADGNLVIALADMALYDLFSPRRLQVRALRDRLTASDILACDANLPAETISALAATATEQGKPLAAIAISPAKVIRLKAALPALKFLFMNEAEARALSEESPANAADWPTIMKDIGLMGGIITRGMKPAIGWIDGETGVLAPPAIETIGDVTGAGDAFAAGVMHAFSQKQGLADMMRYGTASARLAVLSPLAAPSDYSANRLADALSLVPNPEMLA